MDTFLWAHLPFPQNLAKTRGWLETHIMIPASWIIEKKNWDSEERN